MAIESCLQRIFPLEFRWENSSDEARSNVENSTTFLIQILVYKGLCSENLSSYKLVLRKHPKYTIKRLFYLFNFICDCRFQLQYISLRLFYNYLFF